MSLLEPEIQLEIKSDPWTLTRSTMHWFVMRRETENEIQVAATGLRINPITTRRIVRGFTGRTRAAAIDSNATRDAARRIQGQSFLTEREVEIANARADAGNERIMAVLNGISDGTGSRRTVSDWWQWWDRYADIERPQEKRLVKVAETRVNEVDIPVVTVQERGECFAPETPVMTRQGLRPIRSIQPGDLVLSKDVSTGELAYKPVLHKSVGRLRALLRLTIGSEEFITTAGHQFWQSGDGWKQARQLSVDGRIHSLQRSEAVQNLTGGPVVAPHNLVVADTHTFFVGESLLLVHDLMLPRPTNCVVPGLAKHELNDVDR